MEGYAVHLAANGREALDLLLGLTPTQLPGCIILDLMMPVMDGVQFLETLDRQHQTQLGHIPIVVATARSSGVPMPVTRAQQTLRKPFELDHLYAVVAQFCGTP